MRMIPLVAIGAIIAGRLDGQASSLSVDKTQATSNDVIQVTFPTTSSVDIVNRPIVVVMIPQFMNMSFVKNVSTSVVDAKTFKLMVPKVMTSSEWQPGSNGVPEGEWEVRVFYKKSNIAETPGAPIGSTYPKNLHLSARTDVATSLAGAPAPKPEASFSPAKVSAGQVVTATLAKTHFKPDSVLVPVTIGQLAPICAMLKHSTTGITRWLDENQVTIQNNSQVNIKVPGDAVGGNWFAEIWTCDSKFRIASSWPSTFEVP